MRSRFFTARGASLSSKSESVLPSTMFSAPAEHVNTNQSCGVCEWMAYYPAHMHRGCFILASTQQGIRIILDQCTGINTPCRNRAYMLSQTNAVVLFPHAKLGEDRASTKWDPLTRGKKRERERGAGAGAGTKEGKRGIRERERSGSGGGSGSGKGREREKGGGGGGRWGGRGGARMFSGGVQKQGKQIQSERAQHSVKYTPSGKSVLTYIS
jgi:hypothetical protein